MKLGFYDVGTKKRFETDVYNIVKRNTTRGTKWFAVTNSESGSHKCWRVITEAFAQQLIEIGTPLMD